MDYAKVSISSAVVVALGVLLFIIARKKTPAPIVNTQTVPLIYDGLNAPGYIDGPRRLARAVASKLSPSQAKGVQTGTAELATDLFYNGESFRDTDRII